MNALLEYQREFDELVDIAYHAYYGRWHPATNSHSLRLRSLLDGLDPGFSLDREDVSQKLWEVWVRLFRSYQDKKTTDMGLRSYLLSLSVWKLEKWLRRESSCPAHALPTYEEKEPFALDICFLIRGTDFWPLSILTPYERYLIFLKFKEEKSIVEIAEMTQQTRQTVSTHLRRVLRKLRSASHVDAKESARVSTAADGSESGSIEGQRGCARD